MLLNGKVIEIVSYTSENIDDDLIIYNESFKKIIILNHTAKYVWNLIIDCYN